MALFGLNTPLGNGGGVEGGFDVGISSLPLEPTFADQGTMGQNLLDLRPGLVPDAHQDDFISRLFSPIAGLFNIGNKPEVVVDHSGFSPTTKATEATFLTSSHPSTFKLIAPESEVDKQVRLAAERIALKEKLIREGKLKPDQELPSTAEIFFTQSIGEQVPKTLNSIVQGAESVATAGAGVLTNTLLNNLPLLAIIGVGVYIFAKVR